MDIVKRLEDKIREEHSKGNKVNVKKLGVEYKRQLGIRARALEASKTEAENPMVQLDPVEAVEQPSSNTGAINADSIMREMNLDPRAKPEFFEPAGKAIDKRIANASETIDQFKQGNMPPLMTGASVAGQAAGGLLDFVGAAGESTLNKLSQYIPDIVKTGAATSIESVINAVKGHPDILIGIDAAYAGKEIYDDWAKDNKEASKVLDGVANVAMLAFPVGRGAEKSSVNAFGDVVKKKGLVDGSIKKTVTKVKNDKFDEAVELISPIKRDVKNTEVKKSLFGFDILKTKPSERDLEVANTLSKVGFKKGSNEQIVLIKAQEKIVKMAEAMRSKVRASNTVVPHAGVSSRLGSAAGAAKEEAFFKSNKSVSDMFDTYIKKAEDILKKHPETPEGILDARQAFDKAVNSELGKGIVGSDLHNARSAGVRTVRNTLNEILDESVHSTSVKHSLNQQSLLYRATDALEPKAELVGNTVITRAINRVKTGTGIHMPTTPLAAGLTTATVANLVATPAIAATGAIGLGAGLTVAAIQALTKPQARLFYLKAIKDVNRSIRNSKVKESLKQLRADRAVLLELLKDTKEEDQ